MKKYRLIIVLIASIIIFNIAVAIAGYTMTQEINRLNAYSTSLAQQQVALDKMSKDIIDINIFSERYTQQNTEIDEQNFLNLTYNQVYDVKQFYNSLSRNINTFSNGGTIDVLGNEYDVPAPSEEAAELDQHIQEIWQPLSVLIDNAITQFDQEQLINLNSNITFAADYVRKYSEILGEYLGELRNYYQQNSEQYALWLRWLQIFAISFTVLFFGALIFWGLRSLIRSDQQVEKAQQETANIMKTVKEGLFLIDKDLYISGQYSKELEEILGQEQIAGRTLGELLSATVSSQDYETTKDFIEQLFNEEVIESLIHELNPLDQVHIFTQGEDGNAESRYLSFGFTRVYEKDKIINILVSVADVTRQIALEKRMEKERALHDEQIELLSSVLSIPSASLNGFIRNVNEVCQKINYILRGSKLDKSGLLTKANMIFREVHGMKGEASALGLRHFISIAEDMEEKLSVLKRKGNLSGRDFLPLTIDLDKTLALTNKIITLKEKIEGNEAILLTETNTALSNEDENLEEQQFSKLVEAVATRNNKQVVFTLNGWSQTHILEQHQQDKLREVVIQLLRNAVVHGIEDSEIRIQHDKTATGHILCDVKQEGENLLIYVHDDGGGIDFQALQQKAQAEGKIDLSQSAQRIRQDLIKYMFSSGSSTASSQNEDAGRGVGMDLVKSRLQELKAKINLGTKAGQSTTFKIQIPLASR